MKEKYEKTIVEIIKVIEYLKTVKINEGHESIDSEIIMTGEKTGQECKVKIMIDEHDNIALDGDLPMMVIVKEAVKEYYSN